MMLKSPLHKCLVLCGMLLFCASMFTSCLCCDPDSGQEEKSPYIARVFDYCPAPGQFVNVIPAASEGDTKDAVLARAEELLVGSVNTGMVSLGAWGGYIVVGFDHAIVNEPDTVDFKIYGNAYEGNAEPGIVMVSADENGNGLPDDNWYELRACEYDNPEVIHQYRCVYYRPDSLNADILWVDNQRESGFVSRNQYHKQAYYPCWEVADSLVFEGARLPSTSYQEGSTFKSPAFDWGYADNVPNQSSASCFDIDWAVDDSGKAVKLNQINFVKVYTAQQQSLGWIGETSTEITGMEDLHFDASSQL